MWARAGRWRGESAKEGSPDALTRGVTRAKVLGVPIRLELPTDTMFHNWHRVRDGTLSRAAFQKLMTPLRVYVIARLQEGTTCSAGLVAARCREILSLEPALWTLVHVEGVEPTKSTAAATPPAVSSLSCFRLSTSFEL